MTEQDLARAAWKGEPVADPEGTPIRIGATATAYWRGETLKTTVSGFKAPARFEGDAPRVVLVQDDGTEVERRPDELWVFVPDDEAVPEGDLTASIETHAGRSEGHTYIRFSGRAGLEPIREDGTAQDARTQRLREAIGAVHGVVGVAVVATVTNRSRNIVVRWEAGTDEVAVAQAAWREVEAAIPDVRLHRAFWQKEA